MAKKKIDARDKSCPMPVVMTKNALNECSDGDVLEILIDNDTARDNVSRFLQSKNVIPEVYESNGIYTISATTGKGMKSESTENEIVTNNNLGKHVICINRNKMGHGSDELGEILIRAFVNTIQNIEPLPEAVLLYNSGIDLALKNSPVLASLRDLDACGVNILVCGTCLQHFNQKENLAVGVISNMYDIMECQARARHVVTP